MNNPWDERYIYHHLHPPKTNMEPENGGPLEKEIPIGNHHFQVPCYFLGVYHILPLKTTIHVGKYITLGIQSPKLRMVMEPIYVAFWR